jgi:hypothetical protein
VAARTAVMGWTAPREQQQGADCRVVAAAEASQRVSAPAQPHRLHTAVAEASGAGVQAGEAAAAPRAPLRPLLPPNRLKRLMAAVAEAGVKLPALQSPGCPVRSVMAAGQPGGAVLEAPLPSPAAASLAQCRESVAPGSGGVQAAAGGGAVQRPATGSGRGGRHPTARARFVPPRKV